MNHVQWWLLGLAFLIGLGLTLVLLALPARRRIAATPPTKPPIQPRKWPSTDATAAAEFFTTEPSAEAEYPTEIVNSDASSPSEEVPAGDEHATTSIAAEPQTQAPQWPSTEATAAAEFFTTGPPAETESVTEKVDFHASSPAEEEPAADEHATTSIAAGPEARPMRVSQDIFAMANAKAREEYATTSVAVEHEPAPEMSTAQDIFATTDLRPPDSPTTPEDPADIDHPTTVVPAREQPEPEHAHGRHELRRHDEPAPEPAVAEDEAAAATIAAEPTADLATTDPSDSPAAPEHPADIDHPTTVVPALEEAEPEHAHGRHELRRHDEPAPEPAVAEDEFATATIAVEPTTEIPLPDDLPTTVIPVAPDAPRPKRSFFARFRRTKESSADAPTANDEPTTEIPIAKQSRTAKRPAPKKAPPAKRGPVKKARPAKAVPAKKAPPAKLWPDKKEPVARSAPTKKVAEPRLPPKKRTHKLPYEPFGPGSARATLEGGGPAGWSVKGRTDTRLYYTPGDPPYELTVAQVWFKDEQCAARALFTPWSKSSKKR